LLERASWINLGGGYLVDEETDFRPLAEAISILSGQFGLQVFIEPGTGIINSAGSFVSRVIDLFESDGKIVVILDTTVNHMPEVFEYQFKPDVSNAVLDGLFKYVLAGCSCLAGDVFGEYAFEQPLEIGSTIVFANLGAYSLVKAHMFNGINLPNIYSLSSSGELSLSKTFSYSDFTVRYKVDANEIN